MNGATIWTFTTDHSLMMGYGPRQENRSDVPMSRTQSLSETIRFELVLCRRNIVGSQYTGEIGFLAQERGSQSCQERIFLHALYSVGFSSRPGPLASGSHRNRNILMIVRCCICLRIAASKYGVGNERLPFLWPVN